MSDLLAAAQSWLAADPDPSTRGELETLLGDPARHDELSDLFGTQLEFGTAGLRGVLGPGPNRMNRAVVRRTTLGLGRYLLAQEPAVRSRGVVLGRDGRRMSLEFLQDAAGVLAGLGIPAHVFSGVIPTPLVAHAVGALGAAAGVMITASHNPPAYNGYKVYWGNGAQIIPPHDSGIAAQIEGAGPAGAIAVSSEAEAGALWRAVPARVEAGYLDGVEAMQLHREVPRSIAIAYTPMHGVGNRLARAALSRAGFTQVETVPEQAEPDGAFPTVSFPNPEEPGAMDRLIALATRMQADLAIANDPDADRMALAVRDPSGRYVQLSGDQAGILLGHYLLTEGTCDQSTLVVTTVVSSSQLGVMARELGMRYAETLTGFKWIANRALELERTEGAHFAFGYEEALGYEVGTLVRDKDGISAAAVAAELAAVCKARGETLLDELARIQRRFGVFSSSQKSVVHPGTEGATRIRALMNRLRQTPPCSIGALEVLAVRDLLRGVRRIGTREEPLGLPPSDVLVFELEQGARVVARPSGTEPKIKFYFETREQVSGGADIEEVRGRGRTRLAELQGSFLKLLES